MSITDDFLKEYDTGDLKFNNLQYRKGAPNTCKFGLAPGYSQVDGRMVFNTVRIHSGVDRAKGNTGIIYSPFDFDLAVFNDYGIDHTYGSLLRLFNFKYRFEMRIVHINPQDLHPTLVNALNAHTGVKRNSIIGQAGTYGHSSGIHTHTEIVSLDETNIIFDVILKTKYKNTDKNYSFEEVKTFYNTTELFKDSNPLIMKSHLDSLLSKRNIVGTFNDYKYVYKDWYYGFKIHTRYSSQNLFNGM